MSDTYITNITTSTTDSEGNYIIGSSDVLAVFYYDATATGTVWRRDWNISNPINNSLFASEIAPSNWSLEEDSGDRMFIDRFAGWKSTDLIKDLSVTSSGSHSPYIDDYLTDWDQEYGWETAGPEGNGKYAASIDMGSSQTFNYVYILPGWDTDTSKFVNGYRVGVSDSGYENDYTIVASGTTTSGSYSPEIVFLGSAISYRYIKLYVDSNHGSSAYTRVGKMSVFNDPEWSMYGFKNYNVSGGTYAEWSQNVNFTGIDTLYFDSRAYMTNAFQSGEMTVKVDGDIKKFYDWATTGTDWRDTTYDDGWWTRWEESIDVSSYTGVNKLEVMFWDTNHRRAFQGYFDDFSVRPRWYTESKSATRSSTSTFPNEVYVVSDRQGVSILDKSDTSLWMRFNVGSGMALESAARDVFAADGKIYLATSRGLIVLDFVNNKIWKYDDTGIYYRMSITKRNEYVFWYTHSTSDKLLSSDVYSVHGGYWKPTPVASDDELNILVGTGSGLSVVFSTGINNSSFSYPIRKIRSYDSRVVYIGGFESLSRVGIIEDKDVLWYDGFVEQIVMYSVGTGLSDDSFSDGLSSQWLQSDGDLPIVYTDGGITISGTKDDFGDSSLIQASFIPSRPFVATADVRISEWVDRVQGGLHFGVTSGWPYYTDSYSDNNYALMLSAANGIDGPYIQNESFGEFPYHNNWVQNFTDYDDQTVSLDGGSYKVSGKMYGSYGTSYSTGPVTGSKYYWPSMGDFIARIKVKITDFYTVDVGRTLGFVFGVTDGQYLGQGAGTNGLSMALYGDNVDPNPPVYCMASKTNNSGWTWNTTSSGEMFSGDGTSSADWHQWEIRFDKAAKKLYGSVDNIPVGAATNGSLVDNIGIVFGPVGNQQDNVEVYYKDFEIDFGELVGNQKQKYILQEYSDGQWTRPTSSGTHLNGLDFLSLDGTDSAPWRTWRVSYDGTTLSGSIDGLDVGPSVSLDLGDHPRLFLAYDMPSTLSGSKKSTNVQVRNFTIEYDEQNTVISGSPNNFYVESGSYVSNDYNTLYVATSSGVEQLMYRSTTTVSGAPDIRNFYTLSSKGTGSNALLYGNASNCSAVEVEDGAAGPIGLMYVGTTRFSAGGWERLKDRPSVEEADFRLGIYCTNDGTKLFTSLNRSGGSDKSHYIYMKEIGTQGTDWYPIGQALANTDFQDVGDSRVYGWDFEDGNIYFVGPVWFGIYNINSKSWIDTGVNIGTGNVGTGGGATLDDWEMTISNPKKELYLVHNNAIGVYSLKHSNWYWGKLHYSDVNLPLSTADPAIVYSDVDNSLYMLQYDSSGEGNFFRLPLSTLIWTTALSDSPVKYNFDTGISGFYRPYDESVYFLMLGTDASLGRKLIRYDVKAGDWEMWGIDVPSTAYSYMTGAYSYKEDALYVTLGDQSARIYKYKFPMDYAPHFVYWDASDGVTPEESVKARYNRVSISSGHIVGSDSMDNSTLSPQWNVYTTHATQTTVEEDTNKATFYNSYDADNGESIICSPVPMPACDFTATASIKIRDVRKSNSGSNNNNFMFGITDYKGSPGYCSEDNGASEKGQTMVGVNGLWMMAYNDQTTSERYSVWKREVGSDTKYTGTSYQLFNSTDGTVDALYRTWKVDYTHSTKSMSAYIDDVLIGTVNFSGDGFEHGLMVNIGSSCESTSVSGELIVDMRDFSVVGNDSASMVSNYLLLEDSEDYGYNYYEKYDSTLSSGTSYAYEVEARILDDSATDNVYLNALGCVDDGYKRALLAAVSTGTRKVGIYGGGDPRLVSSYYGLTTQDWSIQSKYSMVHDNDRLKVYIDEESTPSIDIDYYSLPEGWDKCIRFGSFNPIERDIRHHFDLDSSRVTVSGTWTHSSSVIAGSYWGDCLTHLGTSSDAVIFRFNKTGDHEVYVFYSATSSRAVDAPYTVYHGGVVSLPVADGYSTNPINTVNDNVNESGSSDQNTTTVDINQERLADGSLYNTIYANGLETPSGWVYIGTYTNVDRVVVTADVSGADYTCADTVMVVETLEHPKATSNSRIYNVNYTVGSTVAINGSDFAGAFSVIDMGDKILVDAYSDETSPAIVDNSINSLDVIT